MIKKGLLKAAAAGMLACSFFVVSVLSGISVQTVMASIVDGDELVEGLSRDPYYSIHPESSARILSEDEVSFMSDNMRQMAINEIYARYGRRFNTWQVQQYFDEKAWYTGTTDADDFNEDLLTDTEWKNIATLQAYGEYIIEGSDSRYIAEDEVSYFTDDELQLAINEIYARHGRKFVMEEYQDYFDAQSWYYGSIEADAFDESVFNEYENANIQTLLNLKNGQSTASVTTSIIKEFDGAYSLDDGGKSILLMVDVFTDVPYENVNIGDAYAYVDVTIRYDTDGIYYSSGYMMKNGGNTYTMSGSDLSGATITVHQRSFYISDSSIGGGYYEKISD